MKGIVHEHTKEIDGITYTAMTYTGSHGYDIFVRVLSLIPDAQASALLKIFIHEDDGGMSFEQVKALLSDPAVIAALTLGVGRELAKSGDKTLVRDMLKFVTTNELQIGEAKGKGSVYDHFDDHFRGRFGHLTRVLIWAARVGFGVP